MTIAWFGSGPRGASVASSAGMSGARLHADRAARDAYRPPPARPCGPGRARGYALFAGGCAALRL